MSEERFEYAKMKLDVVTPICIGGGKELTPLDYLYDDKEGLVYFVNKKKLSSLIVQKGWLKEFEQYVCSQTGDAFNLYEWLRSKKCHINDIEKAGIILGECEAKVGKKSLNNVSWHIRQADGSVYIPGSSIKGYIRTAILCGLLQKNPDIKKKYWEQIDALMNEIQENLYNKLDEIILDFEDLREDYREKKISYKEYEADVGELNDEFKRYISDKASKKVSGKECLKSKYVDQLDKIGKCLEKELLCKLDFSSASENNNIDELETLADVMRGVFVSDAVSDKVVTTEVLPKNDLIYNRKKTVYVRGRKFVNGPIYEHNPATNAECITPHNIFTFDLKVDRAITSNVGIMSVDDVINVCEKFTTDITQKYKNVFQTLYPKIFAMGKVNLNLGSHTGFLRKTIFLALAPDDKTGFNYMSILLDISFAQVLSKTKNQNGEPIPPRPWMPGCLRYCNGYKDIWGDDVEKVKLFAPRAIKVFPFGKMLVAKNQKPNPNDFLAGMAFMSKI